MNIRIVMYCNNVFSTIVCITNQFVTLGVFYPLVLIVSYKFSISFHPKVSRPRGGIILVNLTLYALPLTLNPLSRPSVRIPISYDLGFPLNSAIYLCVGICYFFIKLLVSSNKSSRHKSL